MKQQQLQKLTRAFKNGFQAGAIMSFTVYVFARILFYEFTFTPWEEISNFFLIIVTGGLLVSAAVLGFVLLEMGIQYISTTRISFDKVRFSNDAAVEVMEDYQTAA